MNQYQKLLEKEEYAFLKNNDRLGKRIILLGLAGSFSYGTNNENSDGSFKKEFFDLVSEYEEKFNRASQRTSLPDEPDFDKVQDLVMEINEEVITRE